MLDSLRPRDIRRFLRREAPPLVVSLGIAEAFFELGSFGLELLCFAGVWVTLDWTWGRILEGFAALRRRAAPATARSK